MNLMKSLLPSRKAELNLEKFKTELASSQQIEQTLRTKLEELDLALSSTIDEGTGNVKDLLLEKLRTNTKLNEQAVLTKYYEEQLHARTKQVEAIKEQERLDVYVSKRKELDTAIADDIEELFQLGLNVSSAFEKLVLDCAIKEHAGYELGIMEQNPLYAAYQKYIQQVKDVIGERYKNKVDSNGFGIATDQLFFMYLTPKYNDYINELPGAKGKGPGSNFLG